MDSEISYWHQLAEQAIEWAKEMGKIHLSYFRSNHLDIELKGSINDVVTAADKASEKYFIEQVSRHYAEPQYFRRRKWVTLGQK